MKRRQAKKIAKQKYLKKEKLAERVAAVEALFHSKLRGALKGFIGQPNDTTTREVMQETLKAKLRFTTRTADNIRGKTCTGIIMDDLQHFKGEPVFVPAEKVDFGIFTPPKEPFKTVVFPLIKNPETLLSTEFTRNQHLEGPECTSVTFIDNVEDMKPEDNLCRS